LIHCLTVAPAFLAVTDNKETGVSFGKWVKNVFFFYRAKILAGVLFFQKYIQYSHNFIYENKLERTTVQMSWSRQQTSKDFRICV